MAASGVAIAILPLLALPLSDAYQPVRALVVGLAVIAAGWSVRKVPSGALAAGSAAGLGVLLVSYLLAAAVNGPASALFGVLGRFSGIVWLTCLVGAALVGAGLGTSAFRILCTSIAAVASLLAAAVVVQAILGAQPQALFGNPAMAGSWFACAAAVLGALCVIERGGRRLAYGLSAGAALVGIGLSGSRGALVGVVVGCLVLIASLSGRRVRVAALAAGGIGLAVVIAAMGPAVEKFKPAALLAGSAASRIEIWRSALRMIAAHPLLGVGPGGFLYEFPVFQTLRHAALEYPDVRADQAHSLLLQVAGESGLPAALTLAMLVVLAIAAGVRATRARDAVALVALVGFSAYLAQAAFAVPAVETDALGWLLGGLLVSRGAVRTPTREGVVRAFRYAMLILGTFIVVSCGYYLRADLFHTSAQHAFARGDFASAMDAERQAIAANPLTDVYRVALADAALFSGGPEQREALARVESGLKLEPRSYDLLAARARLLEALAAPDDAVADAYAAAADAYPLGISARSAAARAARRAGSESEASRYEQGIAALQALHREVAP